jgi:hypothetical protein
MALISNNRSASPGGPLGWQFRVIAPIHNGHGFTEHFAKAEQIGLRQARSLRRQVSLSPDHGTGGIGHGHQADVGELGRAAHIDDVRWFDVTVHQTMLVQVVQPRGQRQSEPKTLVEIQVATPLEAQSAASYRQTEWLRHQGRCICRAPGSRKLLTPMPSRRKGRETSFSRPRSKQPSR